MSHRPNDERTALYRLYDANDVLLYLGISWNPDFRWEQHQNDKHWAHQVARRTVEWHPTRSAALAEEESATAVEKPLHDSSWHRTNDGDKPTWFNPDGQQAVVNGLTQEIEQGRHWIGEVLMSGAVAKRFDVSRSTAANAMADLHEHGLLKYQHFGRFAVLKGPTKEEFDKRFEVPREDRELRRAYLVWTVAELREALKDLPDDTLISARLASRLPKLPERRAPEQ
ncbi:GIY-YIG nuclease family protein [Streptomyces scabiei]|uniref:GIY-YIG nuclease family protein n=1 Tax=Streptomyces scabiei TaxID=1930 RepID=UPI0029A06270|nr:GIY-YIG nuclease family protein [Streptomyces scabiei]MDX2997984.1 GntR family transcriptional regulator [Streptomyces scabiei]MDX3051604.1 GntR family transcriptional regulator [Streptomyces scabiei]